MATINYLIKGKNNATNILLRFKNGRKFDLTASTDLKVEPKKWSTAKQKIKLTADDTTKDEVNNKLTELSNFILDEFNADNSKGEFIDNHWLKKKIAKKKQRTEKLRFKDQPWLYITILIFLF